VSGIAAIGTCHDIAAGTSRAPWPPMAQGATVGQPCADCEVRIDVSDTVLFVRALPLHTRELSLKS